MESIADAARNSRDHKSNSTNHPKIITNDDLGNQYPTASSSINGAEAPNPPVADCDNPDAERLKTDLLAAQGEQDQIRRELSYNPIAVSGGDVDMRNFKLGFSGVDVGSPPFLQTKPPIPARVREVYLEEKIASLTRASRIACDSPKVAEIQTELDHAEQELSLLHREFALDQNVYYSKTNYAQDASGKARIDAEQQQIQSLQSEIERLKYELAASKAN